jgi:hypothetical protein
VQERADAEHVLRPATPGAIDRLRRAASDVDVELDAALTGLGVLPPLDLEPIRSCLRDPSVLIVAECNRDGHRRLALSDRYGAVAWIHHDGTVVSARGHHLLDSA